MIRLLIKRAYDAGEDAAKAKFKLKPMPPTVPQAQTSNIPAQNPVDPVAAMAKNTIQMDTTQSDQKLTAPLSKHSDFNFGMTPRSKPTKGEILADNDTRLLGTNFMDPERQKKSVGKSFDALNVQKPQDFLNEAGEGSVGGPTT